MNVNQIDADKYPMRLYIDLVENANILEAAGTFRVFHGTDAKFAAFDNRHRGSANGTAPINMAGFHFTDSEEVARTFGTNVMVRDVTMNKPLVINAKGATYSDFKHKLNDALDRVRGHDGIIVRNYMDAGLHGSEYLLSTHYIVFDPSQIKEPVMEFLQPGGHLNQFEEEQNLGFEFDVNGKKFVVMFNDEGDGEYYMSFTGEDNRGKQVATLLGDNSPYRVFSGVLAAILRVIEQNDVNQIHFSVDDKEERRVQTYDRMLDAAEKRDVIPDGYVWDRDSNNTYFIFRKGYR